MWWHRVLYIPSHANRLALQMICPDGYFTPSALEAEFLRVLSHDRVSHLIFEAANSKFDDVRSTERKTVFKAAALLLAHQFISENEHKVLLFCPSRSGVLKVDPWVLRTNSELPLALPKAETSANRVISELQSRYAFLCHQSWAVDAKKANASRCFLNRNEKLCLPKIDGFSICLNAEELPTDFGTHLQKLATRLAYRRGSSKRTLSKPGRKSKVEPIAQELLALFPQGLPAQSAKAFERNLREAGVADFSETTLRLAIEKAKNLEKTNA